MRQIPQCRFLIQLRSQAGIAVAKLLLPVRHHTDDFIGRVHLHQQVQRLMLKHHNTINTVRNRDLAASLIGYLARCLGRERKEYQ